MITEGGLGILLLALLCSLLLGVVLSQECEKNRLERYIMRLCARSARKTNQLLTELRASQAERLRLQEAMNKLFQELPPDVLAELKKESA